MFADGPDAGPDFHVKPPLEPRIVPGALTHRKGRVYADEQDSREPLLRGADLNQKPLPIDDLKSKKNRLVPVVGGTADDVYTVELNNPSPRLAFVDRSDRHTPLRSA